LLPVEVIAIPKKGEHRRIGDLKKKPNCTKYKNNDWRPGNDGTKKTKKKLKWIDLGFTERSLLRIWQLWKGTGKRGLKESEETHNPTLSLPSGESQGIPKKRSTWFIIKGWGGNSWLP